MARTGGVPQLRRCGVHCRRPGARAEPRPACAAAPGGRLATGSSALFGLASRIGEFAQLLSNNRPRILTRSTSVSACCANGFDEPRAEGRRWSTGRARRIGAGGRAGALGEGWASADQPTLMAAIRKWRALPGRPNIHGGRILSPAGGSVSRCGPPLRARSGRVLGCRRHGGR